MKLNSWSYYSAFTLQSCRYVRLRHEFCKSEGIDRDRIGWVTNGWNTGKRRETGFGQLWNSSKRRESSNSCLYRFQIRLFSGENINQRKVSSISSVISYICTQWTITVCTLISTEEPKCSDAETECIKFLHVWHSDKFPMSYSNAL